MTEKEQLRQQLWQENYNRILACIGGAGDAGASLREIAEYLGFKGASPHLSGMLDELVRAGSIRKEQGILKTGRGARIGWKYFVV